MTEQTQPYFEPANETGVNECEGGVCETSERPDTITFKQVEGSLFRNIDADGVIVQDSLHKEGVSISFMKERRSLNDVMVCALEAGGILGETLANHSDGGIIREIEVQVNLDPRLVRSLYSSLSNLIAIWDEAENKMIAMENMYLGEEDDDNQSE